MARNTSAAYMQQIKQSRKYCVKVIISYADGTSDTLAEFKDFMKVKIEDACSGTSDFEIGAAIINEAVIALNNKGGKFTNKSFYGASITVYLGIYVEDIPEYLKMGTFIVDKPVAPGTTINLVAYDNMIKADRKYICGINFPATNAQIARDACEQCGLTLKSLDFPNCDYIVNVAPKGEHTCREILSFVAQMGACFARCDADGAVNIRWYSEEVTHEITELRSKNICTDIVTITGVDINSGSETVATSGDEGYKLSVKDNPLINDGDEQVIADFLAGKLKGLSFRPLSVTCRSDASIEAGDRVKVVDEKGSAYETLVTSTTYTVMGAQKVECNASSPVVNSSHRPSEADRVIVESKRYTQEHVQKELTAYDQTVKQLTNLITNSFGVFKTEETQEDGSIIYYLHDKVEMSQSSKIWKMTSDAFAVSSDGGKTWNAGLTNEGNAVVNVLSAIGLNAEWITTGMFAAKDKDGNIVFSVNVDTGEVVFDANKITLKTGGSLSEQAGQVSVINSDEQGTLETNINTKTWEAKYTNADGKEISGLTFDFEKRRFILNATGQFGGINSGDAYIEIDGHNLVLYDEAGDASVLIGYDDKSDRGEAVVGTCQLGYIKFLGRLVSMTTTSLVMRFLDGLWIGNEHVTNDESGVFVPTEKSKGIFFGSITSAEVMVYDGIEGKNVYTGESIARFG